LFELLQLNYLRNNTHVFFSDDSKFGQRMLEKFGWSKGSGLGKNKQGISENIRVEHKVKPTGTEDFIFSLFFLLTYSSLVSS